MSNALFITTIICDDVRREIVGKDILIGVYGSIIQVHTLPVQINLAVWMDVKFKRKGQVELFFEAASPNPDHKLQFQLQVMVTDEKMSVGIYTPQLPFYIDRDGTIKLYAKTSASEKFTLIATKDIRYVPVPSLSNQPQSFNPSPTS